MVHPSIGDRLGAPNAEPVDAAIVSALCAENLVDCGRVEIDLWGCGQRWCGSDEWRLAHGQCFVQRRRQLHCVAMPVDVQTR
jgi:hypothetical protein